MIIDKSGKLFGKINIIDLAVILAVIAVIAGIAVRFTGGAGKLVTESTKIEYKVCVEGVRKYTVDALQMQGAVTNKKFTAEVGKITSVEVSPAKHRSVTADGKVVMADMPERYDCLVTIEADGKETSGGYFDSDNNEISTGREHEINSKYVHTTGTILGITTK